MAVLIDTDLLVDLERGDATSSVELLLGDEDRAISVITVSELLHALSGRRATSEHGAERSWST
jgi:predicted nucleic acid-binding protein